MCAWSSRSRLDVTTTSAPVSSYRESRRFTALTLFIVLLALGLRFLYPFATKVEVPIRGDSNQYVLYAWNLEQHGVFSTSMPDAQNAVSDNYRGPGYPLLIAVAMALAGDAGLRLQSLPNGYLALMPVPDTWLRNVYLAQGLLGAATVLLTILIARLWLSYSFSLFAGILVALWPHLISFTGVLLSETLFGFMLIVSLGLLCVAEKQRSSRLMAATGLVCGLAYLVNPIIALFPVLAAAALALRSHMRLGWVLLAAFAVLPIGWMARGSHLQGGLGMLDRLSENFVQGSWPQYQAAENSRMTNPISREISDAIADEVKEVKANPARGLHVVLDRMALDPRYYIAWYALKKPFLLWDWNIRLGWGDVYFLPSQDSPFERIPVLKLIKQGFIVCNPLIFFLAAMAATWLTLRAILYRTDFPFAPTIVAVFALYVTFVHDILQAEPRYAVAYRPEEVLLTVTAVSFFLRRISWRTQKNFVKTAL
jgi:hypothetical protein